MAMQKNIDQLKKDLNDKSVTDKEFYARWHTQRASVEGMSESQLNKIVAGSGGQRSI